LQHLSNDKSQQTTAKDISLKGHIATPNPIKTFSPVPIETFPPIETS